jgi:hypothetical protein
LGCPEINKKLSFIVVFVLFFTVVAALSITEFTNELGSGRLFFSGNENQSLNLSFFRWSNVTEASFDIGGLLLEQNSTEYSSFDFPGTMRDGLDIARTTDDISHVVYYDNSGGNLMHCENDNSNEDDWDNCDILGSNYDAGSMELDSSNYVNILTYSGFVDDWGYYTNNQNTSVCAVDDANTNEFYKCELPDFGSIDFGGYQDMIIDKNDNLPTCPICGGRILPICNKIKTVKLRTGLLYQINNSFDWQEVPIEFYDE